MSVGGRSVAWSGSEALLGGGPAAIQKRAPKGCGDAVSLPEAKSSARELTFELEALLEASDAEQRDSAWEAFVRRYSRLLLHTVHSHSRGYDDAMNRYVFVLDRLREDDCRRLGLYVADGRSAFSTWIVVVVNRLCVDYARGLYGRDRRAGGDDPDSGQPLDNPRSDPNTARRRLVDQVWADVDLSRLVDASSRSPDRRVRERELKEALKQAVQELESRDRLLLQLKFEEEMTAREIAAVMKYPSPFHVYRRMRTLMRKLRERLNDRGVRGPRP